MQYEPAGADLVPKRNPEVTSPTNWIERASPHLLHIAVQDMGMDRTGIAFTALLIALAALVVSVLLIEVDPPFPETGDGAIVPAPAVGPVE